MISPTAGCFEKSNQRSFGNSNGYSSMTYQSSVIPHTNGTSTNTLLPFSMQWNWNYNVIHRFTVIVRRLVVCPLHSCFPIRESSSKRCWPVIAYTKCKIRMTKHSLSRLVSWCGFPTTHLPITWSTPTGVTFRWAIASSTPGTVVANHTWIQKMLACHCLHQMQN